MTKSARKRILSTLTYCYIRNPNAATLTNRSGYTQKPRRLHVLGSRGTSDNLNQFTSNGSLSGTVVQDLEFVDHVTSVLRRVVHGVAASRLLTSVTLSKSLLYLLVNCP
jgi:hypothetical protein